MAGRKKAEVPAAESQAVSEAAVTQTGNMEFRLINPTEDGFLRVIKWNKEELETAVRQKIASYENVVYTEDNLKQAKADRAELNKLTKAIEERRKMVRKTINEPYEIFESELKEILALIQKPVKMIDKQVKAFEDLQKEEKKKSIQAVYDESIGDLAEVLSFDRVFDSRYLNQTYKLATAQADVKAKIEKVRTDLETIDSLESRYKLNAKDVYIKTLDLSKALAENKRLADLEEKLEAEKKRKAEEEAERKRLAGERRKEAEERAGVVEDQRKSQKMAEPESVSKQPENVTGQMENVIESPENGTKLPENVSKGAGNRTLPPESGSGPVPADGTTIQSAGQQAYVSAVDPFTRRKTTEQTKVQEKRYQTRFYAKGTRGQLEKLIQFMNDNGIEYGRIKV